MESAPAPARAPVSRSVWSGGARLRNRPPPTEQKPARREALSADACRPAAAAQLINYIGLQLCISDPTQTAPAMADRLQGQQRMEASPMLLTCLRG